MELCVPGGAFGTSTARRDAWRKSRLSAGICTSVNHLRIRIDNLISFLLQGRRSSKFRPGPDAAEMHEDFCGWLDARCY